MADNISIEHGQVHKATSDMHDVVPRLHSTAQGLDDSVQAARAGWKGAANVAFNNFAANLHGAIQDVHKSLDEMTQAMGQGNRKFSAGDSDSAQMIGHAGAALNSTSYTNLA